MLQNNVTSLKQKNDCKLDEQLRKDYKPEANIASSDNSNDKRASNNTVTKCNNISNVNCTMVTNINILKESDNYSKLGTDIETNPHAVASCQVYNEECEIQLYLSLIMLIKMKGQGLTTSEKHQRIHQISSIS